LKGLLERGKTVDSRFAWGPLYIHNLEIRDVKRSTHLQLFSQPQRANRIRNPQRHCPPGYGHNRALTETEYWPEKEYLSGAQNRFHSLSPTAMASKPLILNDQAILFGPSAMLNQCSRTLPRNHHLHWFRQTCFDRWYLST